jgi:hypothetical protein
MPGYGFVHPSVGSGPDSSVAKEKGGSEEKNVKPLGLFFAKHLPEDHPSPAAK